MYIIEKLTEKLVTIYYTEKNEWGLTWTRDERQAKLFNTKEEAEKIANIDIPTVKERT